MPPVGGNAGDPHGLKAALDVAKQRAIQAGTFNGLPSDHEAMAERAPTLAEIRNEKDPKKRARLAWKRNDIRKRQRYAEYRMKHAIPEAVAADRARKWRIQKYGTAAARARQREAKNLGRMEALSVFNQARRWKGMSR